MQIKTVKKLKELSRYKYIEVFISLAGGLCKSTKDIQWLDDVKKFNVINYIDGTEQLLTVKELATESNIQEAMDKGALYLN